MKKLIDIAKEILSEITVANPNEVPIPDGWTEQEVTQEHHPEEKDEPGYYEVLNIYTAPMGGWDENHSDIIRIKKDKEGYFIASYYAFGDSTDSKERFNSYYKAKKYAVDEMKAIMEDWETEYDEFVDP